MQIIKLKYYMSEFQKNMMRQITKIYPPQISQSNGRIVVYNPLQQWVETHSSSSLQDLIEIQGYAQPLFLNHCKEEIILQNQNQVFLEDAPNEWAKTMKKKLGSQKKIASQTIKVNGSYFNLNQSGSINVWKQQKQEKQDDYYNPESLKNIEKEEALQAQLLNTSINPESLVREYRHGYTFAPIVAENQYIYSLYEYNSVEGISYNKILKTDIADQEGESSFYSCSLSANIRKILPLDCYVCAYGGQNALIIDNRSQSIVCDFNDLEGAEISCITRPTEESNRLYVSRENQVLILDIRKPTQLLASNLQFDNDIESMQLLNEGEKRYCCTSFKLGNKITISKI